MNGIWINVKFINGWFECVCVHAYVHACVRVRACVRVFISLSYYLHWAYLIFNQNGFGNVDNEYWLGTDVLRQLTKDHAFAVRVDLWSPERGYMYAEYDRILLSDNDDVILNKLRSNSTPQAIPISASEVYEMDSLVVQNTDNCGLKFSNAWLTENSTYTSCTRPLFTVKDIDILWPLEKPNSFVSVNKMVLRIRPHPEMGNPRYSIFIVVYINIYGGYLYV